MRYIVCLLGFMLALVGMQHAATPTSNVPISQMPITTNVLENSYFPLIQPRTGQFTNDNFRATPASILRGRANISSTNIYVTNLYAGNTYISNIYASNIYGTNITVSNVVNTYTTEVFTNVYVTTNHTDTLIVTNNAYFTDVTFFITNSTFVINGNTNPVVQTDALLWTNISGVVQPVAGTSVKVTNLVDVGTITLGSIAYTFSGPLVAGGVLTDVNGTGTLTWDDNISHGPNYWTNISDVLQPLAGTSVLTTNLSSVKSLIANGAFGITTTLSSNLVAGANNLDLLYTSSVYVQGFSPDPADCSINLNYGGVGPGHLLLIQNAVDNYGFTITNGTPLWDSSGYILLPNGDWAPTKAGQTMLLALSQAGNWQEVGRFGGGIADAFWFANNGGTDSISPFVSGTKFYITKEGQIGVASRTNIFSGKDIGIFRAVDVDGSVPVFINTGITDTWPNPHHGSEWWTKLTTNESTMVLTSLVLPSGSGHAYDNVWFTSLDGSRFDYIMRDNTTNRIRLDGLTGDIYSAGKVIFYPGATNYITRVGSFGDLGIFNTDSLYSTLTFEAAGGQGGYVQGYYNAGYRGMNVFGNDFATLAYSGGSVTINVDGFRPNNANTINLGTSGIEFKNLQLNDSIYIRPFLDSTNYSLVQITHTGTNGAVVFSSQANGTAGNPRPFGFTNSPVVLGKGSLSYNMPPTWFQDFAAVTAAGCYMTNVYAPNLPSGDNDIFTPPAGKIAIPIGIVKSTTNQTSGNAFDRLKTNSVYYTLRSATILVTNAIGTGANASFVFQENETYAVNTAQTGANVIASFLVAPTNYPFKCAKLIPLPSGTSTLYTVPAGKMITGPQIAGGNNLIQQIYTNHSGSNRTIQIYIIPSGGTMDSTTLMQTSTVATNTVLTITLLGHLEAGDSVVVTTDGSGANESMWFSFVETDVVTLW